MKRIVDKLIELGKTVSTMESCTGGGVVNQITNIPGASEVLKFSAVTYSNEFKIKMGVSKKIIDEYSVYSSQVAREMSKKISDFTGSDYGIGITGKLKRVDKNNMYGQDDLVYICIYDRKFDKFYSLSLEVIYDDREMNKRMIIDCVINQFMNILNNN